VIGVEFGTLPPYLYALFTILPDKNGEAAARIKSVVLQEMIHMCLACNILNALGGTPELRPPVYPGPLPGDIGPPGGEPLIIHLLPFSEDAMAQGVAIELPEHPEHFPVVHAEALTAEAAAVQTMTIGQLYRTLDAYLATLPPSAWMPNRNQIDDSQFFPGQLFPINGYADAHQAIDDIVSEGEGTSDDPLDFQHELAHYFRFGECQRNLVLTKADNPQGFQWGPETLGIDWSAVYPAIPDPNTHDFSKDPPAARAAQTACNAAYSRMIDALQQAVSGDSGKLGNAVRFMFELRMAAIAALKTPLADPQRVAGPAFLYVKTGASS